MFINKQLFIKQNPILLNAILVRALNRVFLGFGVNTYQIVSAICVQSAHQITLYNLK